MAIHPVKRGLSAIWKLWIRLGHFLGLINSTVILTLFYFAIITPVGFFIRIFRREITFDERNNKATYWLQRNVREPDLKAYTRQF